MNNMDLIEQVITKLVSVSGILGALVEASDSPLSDAIWGAQDYLDKIIDELRAAVE